MNTFKFSYRAVFSLALFGLLSFNALAQSELETCELAEKEARCFFYNSETLWNELIAEIESDPSFETSEALQYARVRCYYGLAGVHMSTYDGDKGVPVLEKAVSATKKLLKLDNRNADYHAMLSALYGMQIGFSPMKGMFLGSKSDSHVDKAIDLEPNNGFAWSQRAGSFYHTPSMFGGDLNEAVKCYRKSAELLELEGDLSTNWQWLEAMTWLGQAYEKTDQLEMAKVTYERALEVFPEFGWINMALLPALKKKMN